MGYVIDCRAHCVGSAFGQHPRNSRRRSEFSGKTLHENCPNGERSHTVCETIDCFGFQTRSTGHCGGVERVGMTQNDIPIPRHNMRHNVGNIYFE